MREHRLYQADWLLRFYGFRVDELTTSAEPNLDMRVDPKTAWAVRHPAQFPVDINTAAREMLLRTPGLGQRSVERILRARRLRPVVARRICKRLRVKLALARPFIIASDWRPAHPPAAMPPQRASTTAVMGNVAVSVPVEGYDDWRRQARSLLARDVPPAAVNWVDPRMPQPALAELSIDAAATTAGAASRTVPGKFLERARSASYHRDPRRWAILYRLAYRLTHGERALLANDLDPDVIALQTMSKQVARDIHKMHAFVRFREVQDDDGPHFIAWHRPDHFIVRPASTFFRERFRVMRWSILTPDESAYWDGAVLTFGPGVPQSEAPQADRLEDLWRTYYKSMFNPARLNPKSDDARDAGAALGHAARGATDQAVAARSAGPRGRMIQKPSIEPSARLFVPEDAQSRGITSSGDAMPRLPVVRARGSSGVRRGRRTATVMLVGEQPGDEEDKQGRPFVGPAGEVLNRALRDAGVERAEVYLTNAVKHFSFHREGKRRIHDKPRAKDVRACRPWLEAEIDRVKPDVIVCLGSTAAQALLGPSIRIQRDRGQEFRAAWAPRVLVTYHPSAVLRADDPQHSDEIYQWLVDDLRAANTPQGK